MRQHKYKRNSAIYSNTSFYRRLHLNFLATTALFCSVVIFSYAYGEKAVDFFENQTSTIYSFMAKGTNAISQTMAEYATCFSSSQIIQELTIKNEELQGQLDILKLQSKTIREFDLIRKYLEPIDLEYIPARMISSSSHEPFGISSMLDVGSDHGVVEGQAVVSSDGMIGRIVKVGAKCSHVMPIDSLYIKTPATFLQSNAQCILTGSNTTGHLQILYLPDEVELIDGDMVITSGEGGMMPYGIRIGFVIQDGANKFVKPFAKSKFVSNVSVIKLQ